MENELITQVLIVGAGPTGLMLALQLTRNNISFEIIDSNNGISELSKALVVHARTLEIYDQLGLASKAVEAGEVAQRIAFMHEGAVNGAITFADFGKKITAFPFLLVFEQNKNEQLLYEELKSKNRDVKWDSTLTTLTQDAGQVYASFTNKTTGATNTIRANYAVGCDGASSTVRHLIGMRFGGSTYPRLFYVADVEMNFEAEDATLHIGFRGESVLLMLPMAGKSHWRFVGNITEYSEQDSQQKDQTNDPLSKQPTFGEIEAKVKFIIQRPIEITKVRWFSTYKVHTRHAENFSLGRCFLAGDAAHVHTPVGGQGMNTGIQDAYNLAWKIALVEHQHASPMLLQSYSEERLAGAKHLLATTDQFFDVATGEQWFLKVFRDNLLPGLASLIGRLGFARELIFPMISQIGLNYRESSLSRNDEQPFKVRAGDRMPYVDLEGRPLYDRLRAPCFHVLIFTDGEPLSAALKSAMDLAIGAFTDSFLIPLYPKIAEVFGSKQPFVLLLRPDNYIGYISRDLSADTLKSYLREVIKLNI